MGWGGQNLQIFMMIIKGQVGHEVSEERRARELWRIRNCPPKCHNLALPKCGWAGPATKKEWCIMLFMLLIIKDMKMKHDRWPLKMSKTAHGKQTYISMHTNTRKILFVVGHFKCLNSINAWWILICGQKKLTARTDHSESDFNRFLINCYSFKFRMICKTISIYFLYRYS